MNILLLSPFFYPEPISTGKYNTDLVKELVKNRYELSVLCSHPIYPDWRVNCSNKALNGVKLGIIIFVKFFVGSINIFLPILPLLKNC